MLVSKELGGAGLIALQLAAAMRGSNRESYAWVPGEGPAMARAREMGVKHREYDATTAFSGSLIWGALSNWKMSQSLRKHVPGLVHVHSPYFYGALSHGLRISGLRTVVHVHIEEEKEALRWAFKRTPDVIITCARFLVDQVRGVLPEGCQDRKRIIAIPNAVDTERFQPGDKIAAKLQVGAMPQRSIVLMVANLAPHKGQETAIHVAAMLKSRGVTAEFWFAGTERGEGENFTEHLHQVARELAVDDRVKFLGQRRDIPNLLRASDVFLLPSTAEGLPLSILEAQACKVPVIASSTAGIPEIIANNETGFLADPNDPAAYAHLISHLLSNHTLYARIADAAYDNIVREYNWRTYIERVTDVYQSLIHSSL